MAELEKCGSCHRPIKWAKTTKDKAIPLDPLRRPWEPEPDVVATAIYEPDGRVRILRRDELPNAALGPRYVVHWATCPHSRRWKEFADRRRARAEKKSGLNEDLGLESLVLVPSRPSR